MSVLNTMLGDLERRGQRPPLSLAPREEAQAPAPLRAQVASESAKRRPFARPAVLLAAAVATAAAGWLWPRPAPAPANHFSAALGGTPVAAPSAPLPPAGVAQPPQAEPLPPPAVERVAPPAQAESGAPPVAAPAPLQPMHPHTPTPRVRQVPVAAASPTAAAEPDTGAGSDPSAVAQSAAQSDLTRAMALVARGRTSEAVQLLAAALSRRPAWSEARSALAALQADGGDRQQALATLLGGVAFDPSRFAPTAAQLQAELDDPAGALQTLDRVPPGARDQTYHGLAGAVAQRAGRHELAVAEYGAALRLGPSSSLAWVGLAVSLQALGRDTQALEAYRTAAGGRLSPDLRRFVEARISAVQASAQPPAAPAP